MYVTKDTLYKTPNGEVYTSEYLTRNGHIEENKLGEKYWTNSNLSEEPIELEQVKIYDYEYESGQVINCCYRQLIDETDSIILCNEISKKVDTLELFSGKDYYLDDDNEVVYKDIYQYFIIDDFLATSLKIHSDEIIYHDSELDLYILGVTHLGTSWDYVNAEYKC